MTNPHAREALQWAQGKLTFAQAINEWASLGAKVTVRLTHGIMSGHIAACGTDWVCLRNENKTIFIPLSHVECCRAEVSNGPAAPTKDQSWIGCLRGLSTSETQVHIELGSGRQLNGRIAVVAPDHLRLVQHERDDGSLGPIVPVQAITCLWQLLPSSRP